MKQSLVSTQLCRKHNILQWSWTKELYCHSKHPSVFGNHFWHHSQVISYPSISWRFQNFSYIFQNLPQSSWFGWFEVGRKVSGACKSTSISSKLDQDVLTEVLLHLQTVYEYHIVSLSLMKKCDFWGAFQIYLKNSPKSRFSVIFKSRFFHE